MTTTISKVGRSGLAVLLSAFVCLNTPAMMAYAEEETVTNEDAIETQAADAEISDTSEAEAPEGETTDSDSQTDADAAVTNDASAISLMSLDADSAADDAAAVEADSNPFDVGSYMELRDAFKYEINTQSNQSFTINLTDDIVIESPVTKYKDEAAHKWVFTMDTHNNRYTSGQNALSVKNGNTVTILGHGHSLIFTDNSTNTITPGTINGNLILGAADGSDSLTLTFTGANHQLGALVQVIGGSLAIHSGVTLSNNVNYTAYPGGGVSAYNGAVVNMDGGVIENCTNVNHPEGGGVYLDDATFNMTGGTIKGNHVSATTGFAGYGGGVAVGVSGGATTFNMSGNAVIEGNSAPNGGGVYVGTNGTFTMSGNAKVIDNTATTTGGGVYVAQGGTFTMGEGNAVTGNNAPHGGGVINFGTATVSNVYDNDAGTAGADIYNNGTITMEPVKAEWSLSKNLATSDPDGDNSNTDAPVDVKPDLSEIKFRSFAVMPMALSDEAASSDTTAASAAGPSNKTIDDWYYDGHRETGETDADGNATVDRTRWNANADTADKPQYLMNYVATGTPTTETMGLKAAHSAASITPDTPETPATVNVYWENSDGEVLFELDKVEVGHVPAATEYNALSGNEDPTEAGDVNHEHEFEGWDRTDEPNGDVIYMATYDDEPASPDEPANPTDPQTPEEHATDDPNSSDGTQASDPEKTTDVGSLQQTGDKVLALGFGLAAIALFALGGVTIAKRRASKN